MTADRIPCVIPRCRRTAPADRFPPGTEIICGKCWRAVPPSLKHRYKKQRALLRRLERRHFRRPTPADWGTAAFLVKRADATWRDIVRSLTAPEKPAGLDTFLEETGL